MEATVISVNVVFSTRKGRMNSGYCNNKQWTNILSSQGNEINVESQTH